MTGGSEDPKQEHLVAARSYSAVMIADDVHGVEQRVNALTRRLLGQAYDSESPSQSAGQWHSR